MTNYPAGDARSEARRFLRGHQIDRGMVYYPQLTLETRIFLLMGYSIDELILRDKCVVPASVAKLDNITND